MAENITEISIALDCFPGNIRSDQILFQIMQGVPIAIFVINTDHVIAWWNRSCETLTGLRASDVIGTQRHWEAFYPEARPLMADLIVDNTPEAVVMESRGGHHRRCRHKDGTYGVEGFYPSLGETGKWLFSTAAPLLDASGAVIGAIETIQDITWYKETEQELLDSEERYRSLMENVLDGVLVLQKGRVGFANNAFCDMLGYDGPWELVGKPISFLVARDFVESLERLLPAIESRDVSETCFQGQVKTKDSSELWVEAHVSVIQWKGSPAVLSTVEDITEKRQQMLALQDEAASLRKEYARLKLSVSDRYRLGEIVGKSFSMQRVYDRVLQAAESEANAIIYGESGTGKELVARAIHDMSSRRCKEFVSVNCGAIPETLLESEFFGYCKGAFTGALHDKLGYLDIAHQGSIFLDEIGEISLSLQAKLLRAIEGGGYTPVGSQSVKKPDIRVIAATNRNLSQMVTQGGMREDFYYRIHVIPIHIPPLRERMDDLILLINHFMVRLTGEEHPEPLPGKFLDTLHAHDWPGNIRELQNVLHRYVTLGQIDLGDGFGINGSMPGDRAPVSCAEPPGIRPLAESVADFEKEVILSALEANRWNRGKTAAMLGINRKTLFKKLQRYGV